MRQSAIGRAKLRILYVEANEDGTVGGSHQALYDLIIHLKESRYTPVLLFYQDNHFARVLRRRGFEVHLFEAVRRQEHQARRSNSLLWKGRDALRAILRRNSLIRRLGIAGVHLNNSPKVGLDDWLPACRLAGIPIVAAARGDAEGESKRWRRFLLRRFDRVLPVSDWLGRALEVAGLPRERLVVVRDGIDLKALRKRAIRPADEVRRELGLTPGQYLVVMVGNIRRWKGQHVLLRALGNLTRAERRQLRVAFAGAVDPGSREYWDDLQRMETELELTESVVWLGSRTDVPDLFAAADMAAHCSVVPEPFGLVVAEALALGTPVAAARFGGPAEVVTSASGWLYDPAKPEELTDILRNLVREPDLARTKQAAARARAGEFSIERTVDGVLAVYGELFGNRASS